MTRQVRITTPERSAHRSRGAQMVAAVRDAWSDCHYASRRIVEMQTGPVTGDHAGRAR